MEIKKELNKIDKDEFGNPQAVLAINKPTGMTSHDVVNIVRKRLGTRKVGHAGALDPFASGVLLILVGKFTKLSENLILEHKEYKGRIILGLATRTQDIEGTVTEAKSVKLDEVSIKEALDMFKGGYEQYVSIYSSVKVGGKKLRELARKAKTINVKEENDKKIAVFEMNDKNLEVEIPKKKIDIKKIELIQFGPISSKGLNFYTGDEFEFTYADIQIEVSKGTYIRQFAQDFGERLEVPAMLASLERTKIGDITLDDCIDTEDVSL